MKKILIITLMLLLLVVFCSCGEESTNSPQTQGSPASDDTQTPVTSRPSTDTSFDDIGSQDTEPSFKPAGSTLDGWTGNKQ